MSLSSVLVSSLQTKPLRPLLGVKNNQQWQWFSRNHMYNAIHQCRLFLRDQNVQKGDRVAFKGRNSVEWLAWNMATNSLGAIWVPMYHEQKEDYCHHILQDCEPVLFLNEDTDLSMSITTPIVSPRLDVVSENQSLPSIDYIHHDVATLIYTSGTTGSPKGVMLSNDNILSNIYSIRQRFHDLPPCVTLNILPWAHIYSQTCELYYNMLYDNPMALCTNRDSFLKECKEIQPHCLYLVPRVLDVIKDKLSWLDRPIVHLLLPLLFYNLFGSRLSYIFTGGAKLSESTKAFYAKHGYFICEGYGCTETSPMISVNHFQSPRNTASIGKPLDDVLVEIVDGEIQVAGPNVMLGYWNQKEETNKVLEQRNGHIWYKTGDQGTLKDGYLYYEGRMNENYKLSNGKFVHVQDVETVVKSFVSGNIVVFGENQSHNELISTEPVSNDTLEKINAALDSHVRIQRVYTIPAETWAPFLTPKMSIKRKPLIEYVEKHIKDNHT